MGKRTEITIEQHEILIVRGGGRDEGRQEISSGEHHRLLAEAQRAWCQDCGQEVVVLSAEAAAQLCGVSHREMYRQLESGMWHFSETAEGVVQVCLAHLLAQATEGPGGITAT